MKSIGLGLLLVLFLGQVCNSQRVNRSETNVSVFECPDYQLANGSVSVNQLGDNQMNNTYPASLKLTCNHGYRLTTFSYYVPQTSTECQKNGTWTTMPNCTVVICRYGRYAVSNAVFHMSDGIAGSNSYGAIATKTCNQEYNMYGNNILHCRLDGFWEPPTFGICYVKKCNVTLPQVAHGFLTFQGGIQGYGTYNATVSLNCQEGYKIYGNGQLLCAENEKWQGSLGLCSVKRCNEPIPQVANGFLIFSDGIDGNGTYNTTVSLSCLEGYKQDGSGQLRCNDNEQWQGSIGHCLVKRCNESIPQVANGFLIFSDGINGNGTYNTTVSLSCLEGYKQDSSGQLRCNDNEQWQGSLGHCLALSCHVPDIDPIKGTYEIHPVLVRNVSYTSFLTIHCKEGYRLTGAGTIRCTNEGKWDTLAGQCSVIQCSGPFILPNNSVHIHEAGIEGNSTYNSTIFIRCEEGYRLSGRHLIRCNEFGDWGLPFGTCEAIDCGWPKVVPQNVPLLIIPGIAGSSTYNATACIQSSKGIINDGSIYETLRCSNEGSWKASPEKCFENPKEEACNNENGKQIILPIAILSPICLILIVTNIVTLFQRRHCACSRSHPRENNQENITIADQFSSSSNGLRSGEQDIHLKRKKNGSDAIQSDDTGTYDELESDKRKRSSYNKIEFKRAFTSNKRAIYANTDDVARI